MQTRLDHVVVRVDDLAAAIDRFTQAGFTVREGGAHGGGLTENALIHFRDGTYLELLHFKKPLRLKLLLKSGLLGLRLANRPGHLRYRLAQMLSFAPGLADASLLSPDLSAYAADLAAAGIDSAPAAPFSRTSPDGTHYAWHIATPFMSSLPFALDEFDPPRIIPASSQHHSNGVTGIVALHYAVETVTFRRAPWFALAGTWSEQGDTSQSEDLKLIYHPASIDPKWQAWVAASRDKPVKLELATEQPDRAGDLDLPPNWHGTITLVPTR